MSMITEEEGDIAYLAAPGKHLHYQYRTGWHAKVGLSDQLTIQMPGYRLDISSLLYDIP